MVSILSVKRVERKREGKCAALAHLGEENEEIIILCPSGTEGV